MKTHLLLLTYILALSIAAYFVVVHGASEEPFVVLHNSDALIEIGGASILMVLWLQLCGAIVLFVWRGTIRARYLWAVPWAAFVIFFLSQCPLGYLEDIRKYSVKEGRAL